MATTPNLQLETNNSSTDGQKKFLTYRMGQNGDISSNATKIDAWAGNVNKKLTTLENSKPAVLVNATWVSVGYYEVVTEEIKEYKVDMLITVRLNKDNDGTTTIKVNDLQVKSLLKYNSEGTLVNVDEKDLRKNHEYQFRYDGTSFVWQNGTSADQISTQGTSGNVIKISQSNTMEDSGIAIGNGELTTTDKTLVGSINEIKTSNDGKIDTTQIKNTLEETVEGNVLDATKGKELNDKIGDTTTLTTTDKTSTVAAINEMNNADTTGSLANKLSILSDRLKSVKTFEYVNKANETDLMYYLNNIDVQYNFNYEGILNIGFSGSSITTIVGNTGGGTISFSGYKVNSNYEWQEVYGYPLKGHTLNREKNNGVWGEWKKDTTQDEMNVLSDKSIIQRGNIVNEDFNTLTQNGIYSVANASGLNKPPYGYGQLLVSKATGVGFGSIAQYFYPDTRQGGLVYYRTAWNDTWSSWRQIATTDKVDILWSGSLSSVDGVINLSSGCKLSDYSVFRAKVGNGGLYGADAGTYELCEFVFTDYPSNLNLNVTGCINFMNQAGKKIRMQYDSSFTRLTIKEVTTQTTIYQLQGVKRGNV